VDIIKSLNPAELSARTLLAVIQILEESDGGYTPLMKRGQAEGNRPAEASARYGTDAIRKLQKYARDNWEYFARCKRAAILHDWIEGEPLEDIERRYSPNPYQGKVGHGDIRKFADLTRYHLRAAHEILGILIITHGVDQAETDSLLRQLELGLPAAAVRLSELPISLSRGEYLTLNAAGCGSPDDVWALSRETLTSLLGETRAQELEARLPQLKP
jgi:hypothetical protein